MVNGMWLDNERWDCITWWEYISVLLSAIYRPFTGVSGLRHLKFIVADYKSQNHKERQTKFVYSH